MAERAVMEAQSTTSRVEQMAELEIKKATIAPGSQDDVVKAERQIFNLERSKLEHRLQEAQLSERAHLEALERQREVAASETNSRVTSARSAANMEAILTLRRDLEIQTATQKQQAELTMSALHANNEYIEQERHGPT